MPNLYDTYHAVLLLHVLYDCVPEVLCFSTLWNVALIWCPPDDIKHLIFLSLYLLFHVLQNFSWQCYLNTEN